MLLIVRNGVVQPMSSGAQYDGSKSGKDLTSWDTFSTDPNEFVRESYGTLSERNTTLYHTFAPARACVNKPIDYIIGRGLRFKSAINHNIIGWNKEKAVEWSKTFSQLLHFLKEDISYYQKQSTICRQAKITGDSIVYFLREDDGRPFDIIVSGGYDIDWENEKSTLGVVTDKYSRATGFYKKDGKKLNFRDKDNNLNAILFFNQETAGQLRGMGCFYSEIARAKGFDRVWDATIARMVMESILMGYFANDNMDGAAQIRGLAAAASTSAGSKVAKEDLDKVGSTAEMTPGAMLQFNNQGSMKFNDLKTPSKNFGDANEYYLQMFAMACAYPKAFIVGDYEGMSYSSGRSTLNDAMKRVHYERSNFVRDVDTPVNLEMLKWLASTGQIEVPPAFWTSKLIQSAMVQGVHLGPVPSAINPLQEVNAEIKEVESGFDTVENKATKRGNDWDSMNDDWAEQNKTRVAGSPERLMQENEDS